MLIKNKDILIVIPARYKSSRFPGKPLAIINGKEMIKRTYDRCILSGHNKNNIIVATESKKIFDYCKKNFIKVEYTSESCLTGTDRIAELARKKNYKIYVNIQGDEPIFNPADIKKIINFSKKNPNSIINGYCEIKNINQFKSNNVPKVVFSNNKKLLFMSRQPIPTFAFNSKNKAYRQICAYAYPKKILLKFKRKRKTPFENSEDIEILRFLELGFEVKMVQLSSKSIPVDVPSDVKKVEKILRKNEQ